MLRRFYTQFLLQIMKSEWGFEGYRGIWRRFFLFQVSYIGFKIMYNIKVKNKMVQMLWTFIIKMFIGDIM